jgi:mono/diheme cytochrome c family protein
VPGKAEVEKHCAACHASMVLDDIESQPMPRR